MTSIPIINQGSSYFAGSNILDQINQLSAVSAIAPLIQTTHGIVSFHTSDTGPSSDHNLLDNSNVLLDPSTGNITALNSLSFAAGNMSPPLPGSVWVNDSNSHLYHGNTDLEAMSGGNVTSLSSPVTARSVPRFNGTGGLLIEESPIVAGVTDTTFYGVGGPTIFSTGIQFPSTVTPALSNIMRFYQSNNLITAITGPYLSSPANATILVERIGNTVTVNITGATPATADGSNAFISFANPLPAFAFPSSNRTGILAVINGGVDQIGAWNVDTSGNITISSTSSGSTLFINSASQAGIRGVPTLTYSVV